MTSTMGRASLLSGFVLGLVLLGVWLVGWRLLSDSASWFAPATALVAVTLVFLARTSRITGSPTLGAALIFAARGAAILAVGASLSVGSFLPAGVAELASPVLGRFGGATALLILAMGMGLAGATGITQRRGMAFHAAIGFALSALWVWSQVERQASFPPPPSNSSLLSSRFDFMLVLGLLFALVAGVAWWLERRRAHDTAISDPNGTRVATPRSSLFSAVAIRWAALLVVLGLVGTLLVGSAHWYKLGLLGLVLAISGVASLALERKGTARNLARRTGKAGLRLVGWLVAWLLLSGLVFFTTSEDLEAVMLRNSVEWRVMGFWSEWTGSEELEATPTGRLSGSVLDTQMEPVEGAAVVVPGKSGQVYSARTGGDGSYNIEGVPTGNYLPMAVAPGFRQAPPNGIMARVTTVRAGRDAGGVRFILERIKPLELASEIEMSIGQPEQVSVENPQPSTATRRAFSFYNGEMLLDGGLVHEPLEELGQEPFPILLIVYPGEASAWEGVSIPLATNGYVVVSYFPRRLLDLQGDVEDLRLLTSLTAAGRLSERGDPSRMALVGGSVSTVYTYLMAREMEGSRVEEQMKAAIQYGGLFDMFKYRLDWERGDLEIDPGISDLEFLLVAFGRPDARPEIYLRFSPHYALGPNTLPPTLLVHAGNDIVVPSEQSRMAEEELSRIGIPNQYLLYPNIEHYLDTSKRDPTQIDMLNQTLDFLQEHVK